MNKFLILILFSGGVLAAPDEVLLGKAQGYPVCAVPSGSTTATQRCLVGLLSNYDKFTATRKVPHGAPRELKRAASAPDLHADAFMAANRNTGLLVLRGDTILAERYNYERNENHRFQSFSMAKTVVAMLIGIALSENKISSIDDHAEKYVPELKLQPYGETSLRHLLTMSSGVLFTEYYNGRDDVSVLGKKTVGREGPGGVDSVLGYTRRARPAGEKFVYASAETQVLGLVLRAATGSNLSDYLAEKIWQPMGAEADATWVIDRSGYETGHMGLNATLRDWGRLGLLLANYGERDGKQIIPADWVKAATHAESQHLMPGTATFRNGYGYQTWLIDNEGKFALLGVRGQAVMVDPVSRIVVVHTAVHANSADGTARGPQFQFFFDTIRALGPS